MCFIFHFLSAVVVVLIKRGLLRLMQSDGSDSGSVAAASNPPPTPTPHSLDLKTCIILLEILTCSQLDVDEISFLSAWQQQEGRLPILDRCQ